MSFATQHGKGWGQSLCRIHGPWDTDAQLELCGASAPRTTLIGNDIECLDMHRALQTKKVNSKWSTSTIAFSKD